MRILIIGLLLSSLCVAFSLCAMEQNIIIWDEVDTNSAEMMSVMLGAAPQLATIEKHGELFIEKADKRVAEPTVDVYRMKGFVMGDDGLVEHEFGLAIARVKREDGLQCNYMYSVLYKEKKI